MPLSICDPKSCQFDLVSLGECMIRLSPPGRKRLEYARNLEVLVGGGEYNVHYALARLGLRTGWVSKLPQNPLGRLIMNHARASIPAPYGDLPDNLQGCASIHRQCDVRYRGPPLALHRHR